jgi:hypothetical protein
MHIKTATNATRLGINAAPATAAAATTQAIG